MSKFTKLAAALAHPQSWNRYACSLNNPAMGLDPSGLSCIADGGTWNSLMTDIEDNY